MEKLYNKIDFVNNTTPALNATNLNRMSKGLDDLDDRVIDLAANIMEDVTAAQSAAEDAAEAADAAAGSATSALNSAAASKSWAVGPSGSGTGTDTNNAKYWAEQAAGAVTGVSSFNGRFGAVTPQTGDYTVDQVTGAVASTEKGANNGIATLDSAGKVPSSQLPSYVDDVIEGYYYNSKFYEESAHTTEITAATGKIYVDIPTGDIYRWSGTAYIKISSNDKADKVSGAISGDFAGLDNTGNLTDSGYKATDFLPSSLDFQNDGIIGTETNHYGNCSTAASTAIKIATTTNSGIFTLINGSRISVAFTYANTASTPQLRVDSMSAKNIYYKGEQITTGDNKYLLSGIVNFIYSGGAFHIVGGSNLCGGSEISAIGYFETGSTCSNPNGYSSGDNFYKDGKFCTAIATIAQGATFTENTNYVKGTIADAITSLNSGLNNVSYTTSGLTLYPNDFEYLCFGYAKIGKLVNVAGRLKSKKSYAEAGTYGMVCYGLPLIALNPGAYDIAATAAVECATKTNNVLIANNGGGGAPGQSAQLQIQGSGFNANQTLFVNITYICQ